MKNKNKIQKLEKIILEATLKYPNKNNDGLYLFYKQLFHLYSKNDDLESLKRVIFLQWYSVSEPQEFTGIPEFEIDLQQENFKRLNEVLINKFYDDELIFMLNHYNEITEWYFNFINKNLKNINVNILKVNTKNRGIMGNYWEGIEKRLNG